MLQLYRRHVKSCRFWTGRSTNGNRRNNNCRCPVWVDGNLNGVRVNKSLKIRSWTRASEIVRDWEIAGSIQQDARAGIAVLEACQAFIADVAAQCQSDSSLKKYRALLVNQYSSEELKNFSPSLSQFCSKAGLQFTTQITLAALTRFRTEWKDRPLSGGKKLERLRAVGRFFVDRGWWSENYALKLKRPQVKNTPTMPFSRDEICALLSACSLYTDWRGQTGMGNASRLRAFILFARYSGLRVSDAASCAVDRLSGNRLFLYTQKTGVPVYVHCPRSSLRPSKLVRVSAIVIGSGPASARKRHCRKLAPHLPPPVQNRRRRGRPPTSLPRHAGRGVTHGGVPMERVSILLRTSSVKITERHYSPWVRARQEQLEADVMRAWRNDPIAQAELLRSDTASDDSAFLRMAATRPRHESKVAAN